MQMVRIFWLNNLIITSAKENYPPGICVKGKHLLGNSVLCPRTMCHAIVIIITKQKPHIDIVDKIYHKIVNHRYSQ